MSRFIDIDNEKFWDILFDEVCVEGSQAERIEKELNKISLDGKEIRAKAIDEFAEKLSLEISESIIWDMLITANENSSLSDTSDKIVDYVIDTSKKVTEQMKAGGMNG